MSRDRLQGLFYVLVAVTGYSFLPSFTKAIYATSTFEPLDIALWRFIFATPAIWLLLTFRQAPLPDHPLPRRQLLGLGLVYSVAAITAFFGLQRIPASIYVILFYTYPAMVTLISVMFLRHRMPLLSWVALGLTLIGVAMTVPDFTGMQANDMLGIGAAFLNAFAVALYYVLVGIVMRGHQAVVRGTAYVITGTLFVLLFFIPLRGLALPQNIETWLGLIGLATVSTAMPITMLNMGINKLGAPHASIMSAVEPLLALVWSMVLLGETVVGIQWLGGVLIVISVILFQLKRLHRKKQDPLPVIQS